MYAFLRKYNIVHKTLTNALSKFVDSPTNDAICLCCSGKSIVLLTDSSAYKVELTSSPNSLLATKFICPNLLYPDQHCRSSDDPRLYITKFPRLLPLPKRANCFQLLNNVAIALECLHSKGYVHGDVSISNIGWDGVQYVLFDFETLALAKTKKDMYDDVVMFLEDFALEEPSRIVESLLHNFLKLRGVTYDYSDFESHSFKNILRQLINEH